MIAVGSLVVVALLSLLITRLATIAFMLTGMSSDAARFQARSALSGTGFTTTEAEGVVNHPVRRRIVMILMLVGGAGLVTTLATLMIGFAGTTTGQGFTRLGILLAALAVLVVLSRSRWFDRAITPLLLWLLDRYTDLRAHDYAGLLHLGGDWGVGQVAVRAGDWLSDRRLSDLDLRAEGVAVLGIERPDGSYSGAPSFDTRLVAGDVLILYGRHHRLQEISDRARGEAGAAAHEAAVGAHGAAPSASEHGDRPPRSAGGG